MKKKILVIILVLIALFNVPNFVKSCAYGNVENSYGIDEVIFNNLREMAKTNDDARYILNHANKYPNGLLKLAASDEDTLEFVRNYPKNRFFRRKPRNIGVRCNGQIPKLVQWDEKWGYLDYGDGNMALNGCAPTALSMVAAGLRNDPSITPYKIAKFAEKQGYYIDGVGTSWNLFTEGALEFGIQGKYIQKTRWNMEQSLKAGKPIICSVGPGNFTTKGHFIVISKMQNGMFVVNDPNSKKRSEILWSYDQLSPQIKSMWNFSLL